MDAGVMNTTNDEKPLRDSKGRFVHGHISITLRDNKTGRFIKGSPEQYRKAEELSLWVHNWTFKK